MLFPIDCLCHVWSLRDTGQQERPGCTEGLCVNGPDQHPEDTVESAAIRHQHHNAGEWICNHVCLLTMCELLVRSNGRPLQALVSLRRLGKYLCSEELKVENVLKAPSSSGKLPNPLHKHIFCMAKQLCQTVEHRKSLKFVSNFSHSVIFVSSPQYLVVYICGAPQNLYRSCALSLPGHPAAG